MSKRALNARDTRSRLPLIYDKVKVIFSQFFNLWPAEISKYKED